MLDSLDLVALRQEVVEDKKREQKRSNRFLLFLAGCLVLAIVLTTVTARDYTPETPFIVYFEPYLLVSALALVAWFWVYRPNPQLYQRLEQYAPAFVARPKASIDWNVLAYALIVFALVIGLALSIVPVLLLLAFAFLPVILQYGRSRLGQWAMQGHHQQRLARTATLLRYLPHNATLLMLRASALLYADQLDDAVKVYRALLSNKRYTKNLLLTSVWMNDLGYGLVLTRRFEEALPLLEAAIRISPQIGSFYDSLATYYLEQGIYPDRALELTQTATEYTNAQLMDSLAVQKATSAHAAVLTGHAARASILLDEVFGIMNRLQTRVKPEIYRQAGYTRRAQGDEAAARELFTKAIELDPDGLFGSLARRALESTIDS